MSPTKRRRPWMAAWIILFILVTDLSSSCSGSPYSASFQIPSRFRRTTTTKIAVVSNPSLNIENDNSSNNSSSTSITKNNRFVPVESDEETTELPETEMIVTTTRGPLSREGQGEEEDEEITEKNPSSSSSPQPHMLRQSSTSTTPFSAFLLANKTATTGNTLMKRVNNNFGAIEERNSTRPFVIQPNPNTYKKIISRKKINQRHQEEIPTTTLNPYSNEDEDSTDPEELLMTSTPPESNAESGLGGRSRAIASTSSNRGRNGKPKPIIMRDHRNETYPINIPNEVETTTVHPPQPGRIRSNNVVSGNLVKKVRKVKVTSPHRRPEGGPGIVGMITSDLPIRAVEAEKENTTIKEKESMNNDVTVKPSAESDGVTTRTSIYKEEFGIHTESFNHEHEEEDLKTSDDDQIHSTMPPGLDSDTEMEATTEHYMIFNSFPKRNGQSNNARFANIRIHAKPMNEASSVSLISTTPKYRDYYSELRTEGPPVERNRTTSAHNLSSSDIETTTPGSKNESSSSSEDNEFQIPSPPSSTISSEEESHPDSNSSEHSHHNFSSTTPALEINIPFDETSASNSSTTLLHVPNNSVEDANNHSKLIRPTPTTNIANTSKDATSISFTKVERPNFASSSYEFSTTKEISFSSSNNFHDEEEVFFDHEHINGTEYNVTHHNSTNNNINITTVTPLTTSSTKVPASSNTNTSSDNNAAASSSSQIPVVATAPPPKQTKGSSESPSGESGEFSSSSSSSMEDVSVTVEPEIGHSDVSSSEEDSGKQHVNPSIIIKDLPSVKVPAMHQFPVLVMVEIELPRNSSLFCSQLDNLKGMIANVYATRQTVSADQIVIYSEVNCTSKDNKSTTVTTSTTTLTSTTPTTSVPAATSNSSSTTHSVTSQINNLKRHRRSNPPKGESLILDKRESLSDKNGNHTKESLNKKPETEEEALTVIYFYVKDKQGKYDVDLTMAFYEFWNRTQSQDHGINASSVEAMFYQKVKRVNMVRANADHLTSAEDDEGNEKVILAIVIASIAAVSLCLIGVLLLVLRHRQSQTKFAKRCTPVTLDDYSLDNISISNSFRRKQRLRGSKRSYTNAAFDDHLAPSRVVTPSTLSSALSDTPGLDAEFRAIPNVHATLDDIPQGAETKNRYANVIPMPDTRVLLTFQEDQPNSDYINANYVRGVNGEGKRYIITQAPLDRTTVDFWRMVWEQQVKVIVMLTDFVETGHQKCAEYYPRSETIDCSQLHGDFQVTLEKREMTDNCVTSHIVIKDMERNLRRDVVHLWYHSWPEKGVPSSPKTTVDFFLKSRKLMSDQNKCPLIIHCSPGTGRSGTLAACDIAMKEFELHQKIDIPRLVLRLRQDRAGVVQTKEQYLHIYEVLNYYATRHMSIKAPDLVGTVPSTSS